MKTSLVMMISCMLILNACTNQKETEKAENMNTSGDKWAIETIAQETMGQPLMLTEPEQSVIRTADELEAFFSNPTAMLEKQPIPEIDFSKEMVLISAMGEMPSSGYLTTIQHIEESEEHLLVHVLNERPGRNCMNLTVITTPIHIVKTTYSDKPVHFQTNVQLNECE